MVRKVSVGERALRFRVGGSEDVDEVVALIESAYRGDTARTGWTSEADLLEGQRTDATMVGAALAAPDSRLLLAHDPDGALVACCQLDRRLDREAYFGSFAVRPGLDGAGIGGRFLAQAERLAIEWWGATSMTMTVIEQRGELIAWYERRGYERTGATRPFPYGDERFGRPLVPDLRFVVLSKGLPS